GGRKQGDDLMIVTLDGDAVLYEWAEKDRVDQSPMADMSPHESQSRTHEKEVTTGGHIWDQPDESDHVPLPNPVKAKQLVSEPLGRVVLVVAPKWHVPMIDPRKPRWAGETTFMSGHNVHKSLGLLSPI